MRKSKYVENWFVTKDPNNVYNLVINTTERYCYHHHYGEDENNLIFQISVDEDESIIDDDVLQEIPKFLPEIEGIWLQSSITIKDQIHYYFIPHLDEWIKRQDRIVLKSEDYNQ